MTRSVRSARSRSRPPARRAGGFGACGKPTAETVSVTASFHGCCDGRWDGRRAVSCQRRARGTNQMIASEGTADAMIKELERGFTGQLLAPQDRGYDDTRKVYNGMID